MHFSQTWLTAKLRKERIVSVVRQLISKARLAEDQHSEEKLRDSKNVYDMIKTGKRIRSTDAWKRDEVKIMAKAAVLKFSQNPTLLEKLKKTEGNL